MAQLRLPRSARLLRPADFRAPRDSRQRLTTRNFVAEFWPAPAQTPRLGMAVSRRVSKRAVVRNRVRRQIRESFRLHRNSLRNVDILVIARIQAASMDNTALREDLIYIWRKLTKPNEQTLKPNDMSGTMRADV